MARVYLAKFVRIADGFTFYKVGHTQFSDAFKRLENILEPFPGMFEARVLASIYHPDVEVCKRIEEDFKEKYPKNFWIEEKLSGITECFQLDYNSYRKILNEFYNHELKVK